MLKVSVFYLEKQKVLFLKRIFCQFQKKNTLYTDPSFYKGCGSFCCVVQVQICQFQIDLVFETVIKN